MVTIIANKQTIIAVTISNGPVVSPVWKIDGNAVQYTSDPLIISANTFVAGTTHEISFTAQNTCGSNTKAEPLIVTDGTTPPPGLIINGTFDTILSPWGWYSVDPSGNQNGTASVVNGEVVINISGTIANSQLYQDFILNALEPNKQYKIAFNYKGNSLRSEIIENSATYNPIDSQLIPASAIMALHEHTFQTGLAVPANLRFRFWFTSAGVYNIDNVSLTKISDCPNPSCGIIVTQI